MEKTAETRESARVLNNIVTREAIRVLDDIRTVETVLGAIAGLGVVKTALETLAAKEATTKTVEVTLKEIRELEVVRVLEATAKVIRKQ